MLLEMLPKLLLDMLLEILLEMLLEMLPSSLLSPPRKAVQRRLRESAAEVCEGRLTLLESQSPQAQTRSDSLLHLASSF